MSFRSWLKSWLLADPQPDTLYAAIDQELARQGEPDHLDTSGGIGEWLTVEQLQEIWKANGASHE